MDVTTFTGYVITISVTAQGRSTTGNLTFVARYDWKIDSYHPNDNLSTILLTLAPRRDLSRSAESTPFARGMNRFSRQTAIWMGMRHSRSTSHSPTRYRDTSHSGFRTTLSLKDPKSVAETLMRRNSSPIARAASCHGSHGSSRRTDTPSIRPRVSRGPGFPRG